MSRYDKYDPISGGFRAPLAADLTTTGEILGVGLDANGRVVVGGGNTGVLAALVVDQPKAAGDIVDCMTDGEIVDVEGLAAGTVYYAGNDDGALGTVNTDIRIGHTVQATRLVVRAAR